MEGGKASPVREANRAGLSAPHEVDDLDHVAVVKLGLGVVGPRHDLAVLLHGHRAASEAELLDQAVSQAPEHHLVSLADVGAFAAFLVSDSARSISGNIAFVDGGQHVVA